MDTKHLKYLLAIAKEQNMTKAAEQLYVSQSSLSHHLNKLEDEIGMPLFLRGKTRMLPTKVGELYLGAAQEILDIQDRLYREIQILKNGFRIRISATSQWGLKMIADIIPLFKDAFPNVSFEVSHLDIDYLLRMIDDGTLDFALISSATIEELPPSAELLRYEEVFLAVPASHPYCSQNPSDVITQEEAARVFCEDTFLASKKGTAHRVLCESLFRQYRYPCPSVTEVNGMPMTRQFVSQGVGIAFIPMSCKEKEPGIHYYELQPRLYRCNALLHRQNMMMNTPEETLHAYILDCFKDS